MEFEFDPLKSESNRVKHGMDFESAQALWKDESALIVPARTENEVRFALIARIGDKAWTCVYTVRSNRIRIISVRRARDDEKEKYDQR